LVVSMLRAICSRDCFPVPRQEKHVPDLIGLPFTTAPHEYVPVPLHLRHLPGRSFGWLRSYMVTLIFVGYALAPPGGTYRRNGASLSSVMLPGIRVYIEDDGATARPQPGF